MAAPSPTPTMTPSPHATPWSRLTELLTTLRRRDGGNSDGTAARAQRKATECRAALDAVVREKAALQAQAATMAGDVAAYFERLAEVDGRLTTAQTAWEGAQLLHLFPAPRYTHRIAGGDIFIGLSEFWVNHVAVSFSLDVTAGRGRLWDIVAASGPSNGAIVHPRILLRVPQLTLSLSAVNLGVRGDAIPVALRPLDIAELDLFVDMSLVLPLVFRPRKEIASAARRRAASGAKTGGKGSGVMDVPHPNNLVEAYGWEVEEGFKLDITRLDYKLPKSALTLPNSLLRYIITTTVPPLLRDSLPAVVPMELGILLALHPTHQVQLGGAVQVVSVPVDILRTPLDTPTTTPASARAAFTSRAREAAAAAVPGGPHRPRHPSTHHSAMVKPVLYSSASPTPDDGHGDRAGRGDTGRVEEDVTVTAAAFLSEFLRSRLDCVADATLTKSFVSPLSAADIAQGVVGLTPLQAEVWSACQVRGASAARGSHSGPSPLRSLWDMMQVATAPEPVFNEVIALFQQLVSGYVVEQLTRALMKAHDKVSDPDIGSVVQRAQNLALLQEVDVASMMKLLRHLYRKPFVARGEVSDVKLTVKVEPLISAVKHWQMRELQSRVQSTIAQLKGKLPAVPAALLSGEGGAPSSPPSPMPITHAPHASLGAVDVGNAAVGATPTLSSTPTSPSGRRVSDVGYKPGGVVLGLDGGVKGVLPAPLSNTPPVSSSTLSPLRSPTAASVSSATPRSTVPSTSVAPLANMVTGASGVPPVHPPLGATGSSTAIGAFFTKAGAGVTGMTDKLAHAVKAGADAMSHHQPHLMALGGLIPGVSRRNSAASAHDTAFSSGDESGTTSSPADGDNGGNVTAMDLADFMSGAPPPTAPPSLPSSSSRASLPVTRSLLAPVAALSTTPTATAVRSPAPALSSSTPSVTAPSSAQQSLLAQIEGVKKWGEATIIAMAVVHHFLSQVSVSFHGGMQGGTRGRVRAMLHHMQVQCAPGVVLPAVLPEGVFDPTTMYTVLESRDEVPADRAAFNTGSGDAGRGTFSVMLALGRDELDDDDAGSIGSGSLGAITPIPLGPVGTGDLDVLATIRLHRLWVGLRVDEEALWSMMTKRRAAQEAGFMPAGRGAPAMHAMEMGLRPAVLGHSYSLTGMSHADAAQLAQARAAIDVGPVSEVVMHKPPAFPYVFGFETPPWIRACIEVQSMEIFGDLPVLLRRSRILLQSLWGSAALTSSGKVAPASAAPAPPPSATPPSELAGMARLYRRITRFLTNERLKLEANVSINLASLPVTPQMELLAEVAMLGGVANIPAVGGLPGGGTPQAGAGGARGSVALAATPVPTTAAVPSHKPIPPAHAPGQVLKDVVADIADLRRGRGGDSDGSGEGEVSSGDQGPACIVLQVGALGIPPQSLIPAVGNAVVRAAGSVMSGTSVAPLLPEGMRFGTGGMGGTPPPPPPPNVRFMIEVTLSDLIADVWLLASQVAAAAAAAGGSGASSS